MRGVLALIPGVLPLPALALSCMPWQMENAFHLASDSAEPYIIVLGNLAFSKVDLPQVDWQRQDEVPPNWDIPARLRGHVLTARGTGERFDQPVTLALSCSGPWCPSATPGAAHLAFVRITAKGLFVDGDACQAMYFEAPDQGLIERVQSCLRGESCAPAEMR